MSPKRWFFIVIAVAVPIFVVAAIVSLNISSPIPAGIAGAATMGAAFGRPGAGMWVSGKWVQSRTSWDNALIAIGAVYAGLLAGITYYNTHP